MIPEYLSSLANHLWQSTLFAGLAALLALVLRKNRASVRYWVWMTASVKFLIPFSLLVSIGSQLEWRGASTITKPGLVSVLGGISQPFPVSVPKSSLMAPSSGAASSPELPVAATKVPSVLFGAWLCGCAVVGISWFREWRRVRVTLKAASPLPLETPIETKSSPRCVEPGVVGILRPVLLLPEGITDRLTKGQWEAILVHELCHVRRRDNLAAAVHMVVETLFWFHPLVWWLERRLVEERERACDEEVLRVVGEPEAYAEGILAVCKFHKESSLVCVSGVTGSNLKNRIEEIMMNRMARNLGFGRILLLVIAGLGAVAIPVGFGIVSASQDAASRVTEEKTPPSDGGAKKEIAEQKQGSQGWLDEIESAGYRNLDVEQLIRLREHEIDAAYIRQVRALGFELSADELVRFREHEVTADFISEMKQLGLQDLSADQLIRLREHEAVPARIRQIQSMGYPNVSVDEVIRLLEHDVTPEYINQVRNRFKDVTLDQLIRLKEHDIFPTR